MADCFYFGKACHSASVIPWLIYNIRLIKLFHMLLCIKLSDKSFTTASVQQFLEKNLSEIERMSKT